MKLVGVLFIVLGVLMLIFRSFSFTRNKKVVDFGSVEITRKENKTISWPLYAGGVAVAGGATLLVLDRTRRRGSS